jgi:hypothetical protein
MPSKQLQIAALDGLFEAGFKCYSKWASHSVFTKNTATISSPTPRLFLILTDWQIASVYLCHCPNIPGGVQVMAVRVVLS